MLNYKIITYQGVYLEGEAEKINCTSTEGQLTLLTNHIPVFLNLVPSNFRIINGNNREEFTIGEGILNLINNEVTILVQSIEKLDEIDLERALKAKQKAEENLKNAKNQFYIDKANIDLIKAINRIRNAKK